MIKTELSIYRYPAAALDAPIRQFPRIAPARTHIRDVLGEPQEYRLHTLPIFGYDRKDGSPSKKYIVGGWRSHWEHIERMTLNGKGHFYEMLQSGVPLRLFYDIDLPPDTVDFDGVVQTVIDATACCLEEMGSGSSSAALPVVLDATSDKKKSRHLVYPDVVFADMGHLKRFVEHVVSRISQPSPANAGVDMTVYTKDRVLRILGSSKRTAGGGVPFRLLGEPQPFTFETLMRTLVSPYQPRATASDIPVVSSVMSVHSVPCGGGGGGGGGSRKRMRTATGSGGGGVELSDAAWDTMCDRVERHLRRKYPSVESLYPTRQGDYLEFTISPGLSCPNNHDLPHKSNKTWFRVHVGHGWGCYSCCDPECRTENGQFSWGKKMYTGVIKNPFL
jgi:hypothetical protein